jgi:AcrR family transcriptional regulator
MSRLPSAPASSSADLCVADRILTTASELFYKEGIQAVGIQRLIEAAGVAKASLYAHYASKDEVVAAYLRQRTALARAQVAEALAGLATPEERLARLFDLGEAWVTGNDFRGCPFQNAAGELADPAHPARAAISAHRAWLRSVFDDVVRETGVPDPERLGGALLALFDGAAARVLAERRPDAIHDVRWAGERLLAGARRQTRA